MTQTEALNLIHEQLQKLWLLGDKAAELANPAFDAIKDLAVDKESLTTKAQPKAVQEPSTGGVLFAVEQAIENGDCPWEIESAFDAYETERKALAGIKGKA